MSQVVDYILTPKSATVVFMGNGPVTVLASDEKKFKKVKELIKEENLEDLIFLIDLPSAIDQRSNGKFTVQNGGIVIDGARLPSALSKKLLQLVEAGEDTTYLENFWDNLSRNPTQSSREDLFAFLQANNVPITRDGCFIVYKKVLDTWWDSHTGKTHLNKPGMTVKMPREDVDQNRNNTCSAGLHVAAFEYASNFSGTRLLEVKVNPRDVVAVPPDYSQQKMRVCRYQVLRETKEKYVEPVYKGDETQVDAPLVDMEPEAIYLTRDKERRIRIPGSLIRKGLKVGVGRRVSVFPNTEFELLLKRGNKKDGAEIYYMAQSDNCVRLSATALSKLDGGEDADQFMVVSGPEGLHVLVSDKED